MAKIKVKCGNCGREFYMKGYEKKSCPNCGKLAIGKESSGGCFLTTAYVEYAGLPDDCWELQVMRKLRDEYIRKLPDGNAFILEYYATAPAIVSAIRAHTNYYDVFNKLSSHIRIIGQMIDNGQLEKAFVESRNLFLHLKLRYLKSQNSVTANH